jgi:hypothetical protein
MVTAQLITFIPGAKSLGHLARVDRPDATHERNNALWHFQPEAMSR